MLNTKLLDDVLLLVSATGKRNWYVTAEATLAALDSYVKIAPGVVNTLTKSETLVLADALSKSGLRNKWLADGLLLVDASVKGALRGKTLGDTLQLSDLKGQFLYLTRAQLEQIVLSDGLSKFGKKTLTVSDQLMLLDNATRYIARGKVLTESMTVADLIAASLVRVKRLDDNVLQVDGFTKSILSGNVTKVLEDALQLNDANVFKDWTVFFSEHLSTAETVDASKLAGNVKTKSFSDFLQVVSANRFITNEAYLLDGVLLEDSITVVRKGLLFKTLTESLVLVDYAAVVNGRTLVEAIKLDDTQGRYAELEMIAEDDNVLADEIVKTITGDNLQSRTLTDTILLTSATLRRNYTVIADALASMSDSFTKSIVSSGVVNTKDLVDNLLLTSDSSWGRVIAALATDEIAAVTDAFTKAIDSGGLVNTKNLVDNLTLLDQRLQSKFVFAVKNDLLLVLDSVVTSRLIVRWLADTLRLVDSFASIVTGIKVKLLSDSLVLSDGVSEFRILYRALSEQIVLPDEFSKGGSKALQLDDAVLISDSLQKVRFLSRQLQDVVNQLVDTKILERVISRVDNLTIADQRVSYVTRVRALADYLGFDEQVQRALTGRIEKTDTLVLSDEMIARFLPFLQYEVHLKLGVAAKEMTLGVDVVTKLGVDRKLMELAVA